jgi:hypothetical protein
MGKSSSAPQQRHSNDMASGKPGAVHFGVAQLACPSIFAYPRGGDAHLAVCCRDMNIAALPVYLHDGVLAAQAVRPGERF